MLALLTLLSLGACGWLGYGWQAMSGHVEVLQATRPIEAWLADPETPQTTRGNLERALAIRAYASRELGLPKNASYTRYADLKRPAVVWNVFAAPVDSLVAKTWCFPVAGCVPYRGYFRQADAQAFAASLGEAGYETYIGPVPAYSTLGWLDDPLLNTFVNSGEIETARLVFHELAHQVAYVPGDAEFNESFATTVEQLGVAQWLAAQARTADQLAWQAAQRQRIAIQGLLLGHRQRLEVLFRSGDLRGEALAREKAHLHTLLLADYSNLKAQGTVDARYDRFFSGPLNNAQMASFATYTRWVDSFSRLRRETNDWPSFYARVRELAAATPAQRESLLVQLSKQGY